jgi:hypothetical protein
MESEMQKAIANVLLSATLTAMLSVGAVGQAQAANANAGGSNAAPVDGQTGASAYGGTTSPQGNSPGGKNHSMNSSGSDSRGSSHASGNANTSSAKGNMAASTHGAVDGTRNGPGTVTGN